MASSDSANATNAADGPEAIFNVPAPDTCVFNFDPAASTPETEVLSHLLSWQRVISVVGMRGVGKTTLLRALAHSQQVRDTFCDVIWMIELGVHATLDDLVDSLRCLVAELTFRKLISEKVPHLFMNKSTYAHDVLKLLAILGRLQTLLIIDDVWNCDKSLYSFLIDKIAVQISVRHTMGTKLLASTHIRSISKFTLSTKVISIEPKDPRGVLSRSILCTYAYAGERRDPTPDFTREMWIHFNGILDVCAGLPLALAVAGASVQQIMMERDDSSDEAWSLYWIDLQESLANITTSGTASHNTSLFGTLQTTLSVLQRGWRWEKFVTAGEAFESLSVLSKDVEIPVEILCAMWACEGVVAKQIVAKLSDTHLLYRKLRRVKSDTFVIGISMHALVEEYAINLATDLGREVHWHSRVVQGLRGLISSGNDQPISTGITPWWDMRESERYPFHNIVRHLVEADKKDEAVELVTDFRWIQSTVAQDGQARILGTHIRDLKLLRESLASCSYGTNLCIDKDAVNGLREDILDALNAFESCSPYCSENQRELEFQVYAHLRGKQSNTGFIERILWSMEQYTERPWLRLGQPSASQDNPFELRGGRHGPVKRVLHMQTPPRRLAPVHDMEEMICGDVYGNFFVIDRISGQRKHVVRASGDHTEKLVSSFAYNLATEDLFLGLEDGRLEMFQKRNLQSEWHPFAAGPISAVAATERRIVACSSNGLVRLIDANTGDMQPYFGQDESTISDLTFSTDGSLLVSVSDHRIMRWNAETVSEIGVLTKAGASSYISLNSVLAVSCIAKGSDDVLVVICSLYIGFADPEPGVAVEVWTAKSACKVATFRISTNMDIPDLSPFTPGCFGNVTLNTAGTLVYTCVGVSGSKQKAIAYVHSITSRQDVNSLHLKEPVMEPCSNMALSADATELFLTFGEKVLVVDARLKSDIEDQEQQAVSVFTEKFDSLGVTSDGRFLLTAKGNSLSVWDAESLEIDFTVTLPASVDRPSALCGTRDRKYVAFCPSLNFVQVWLVELTSSPSSAGRKHGSAVVRKFEAPWSDWDDTDMYFARRLSYEIPLLKKHLFIDRQEKQLTLRSSDAGGESFTLATWGIHETDVLSRREVRGCRVLSDRSLWRFLEPYYDELQKIRGNDLEVIVHEASWLKFHSIKESGHGIIALSRNGHERVGMLEKEPDLYVFSPDQKRLWWLTEDSFVRYADWISEPDKHAGTAPAISKIYPIGSTYTSPNTVSNRNYSIFISHSGEDKEILAVPLWHMLEEKGYCTFLDKEGLRPGMNAPEEMERAMKIIRIGVVILSPEFIAKKWTMKELLCFQERCRKARSSIDVEPIIIPVFYRMGIYEWRNPNLFQMKDATGENVFVKHYFFDRQENGEISMKAVRDSLQSLSTITGIENEVGATNADTDDARVKRETLLKDVVAGVEEAYARLPQNTT